MSGRLAACGPGPPRESVERQRGSAACTRSGASIGPVLSIRRRVVALTAAALVAGSAAFAADTTAQATTTAPPFQLVSTIKVGGKPTRVAFGYGAAWTLNTNGSVSRIDAGT